MTLVRVRDLQIEYRGARGTVRALDEVSLRVDGGEVVALVGESGSGKTTLAMAIGRLLHRSARILGGEIVVGDQAVQEMGEAELRRLRATRLGYVFQDPVASLDPTMKIGRQVEHVLRDRGLTGDPAEALAAMQFRDVRQVLQSYPHEVSGGMAQRVAIAMTLARAPAVLVADEPTAALDASIRTEVLGLMATACRARGIAFVLATHDLAIVRRFADRVVVMYAGRVVEEGRAADLLARPGHPYTRALLGASLGHEAPGERLMPIPGTVQAVRGRQVSCAFADRCAHAQSDCARLRPEPVEIADGHAVCCLRAGALEPAGNMP